MLHRISFGTARRLSSFQTVAGSWMIWRRRNAGKNSSPRTVVRRAHVKAELAKMDPRQTKAADRSRREQCPDISPVKAQARAEIWLPNERCALREP